MQHPAIKSERLDPASLPPSYHLQQQQQHKETNSQSKQTPTSKAVGSQQQSTTNTVQPVNDSNLEAQPDFQSIKGVFGWTVIDYVNIPFILRGDKQFVSVRIVEMKLLSRYPNSYPDDLGKHAPLTSFFITTNEAKLLNEINVKHCNCEYGKKEFSSKELIVLLSDFIKFYELVKKTFPNTCVGQYKSNQESCAGWLQIKNTVTPYIKRPDGEKYVPLSVIQYAAGLLTNEKVTGILPTQSECQLLNEACKKAGVEFVFSDNTKLIRISQIIRASSVQVMELPSSNPLKHATYMELPTTGRSQTQNPKQTQPTQSQNQQKSSSNPYVFQPFDSSKASNSSSNPSQASLRAPLPGNQMLDQRMMTDPRFAEMMRMQQYMTQNRPQLSNGPPNMSLNPANNQPQSMTNLMQYYLQMQNSAQVLNSPKGPLSSPQPGMSQNGIDTSNRISPGVSSNPSPRSRPPSGPSGSRPPSNAPMSPTGSLPSPHGQHGHFQMPDGLGTSRHASHNGQVDIQHLQNMLGKQFAQNTQQHVNHTVKSSAVPQQFPTNPRVPPSANQEIPGLFTPTGLLNLSGTATSKHEGNGPPPLVRMTNNSSTVSVSNGVNGVSPKDITGLIGQLGKEPVKPQSLTTVKPKTSLVNSIKGAWLNNKSISCLFIEPHGGNRSGQFCLVEAVCKLYFNGCSVNEFLFALENVLNVPLVTCDESEEHAFIQYYSLPVEELKCNKMIRFEDLEKYFPQLNYMFPSKEAIAESESEIDRVSGSGIQEPDNNSAISYTDIEAIPMSGKELGHKRPLDYQNGSQIKQPRMSTGSYEADSSEPVIILD